jgi:hypothetical protein
MEGVMRYCASLRLLPLVSLLLAACVSGVGAGTAPISRPGLQGAASRWPPAETSFSLPDDALWEGFLTPGLSSSVSSGTSPHFTEYHGQLVIWGDIDAAGGQSASGVVLWDGLHFQPLPPVGSVRALTVWNDQIVAATYDFSTNSSAILQFDGTQWDTLGACPSRVTGVSVFDGRLAVVGLFTSVNSVLLNRVAAFDGVAWSGFGSGFPSSESPSAVVTNGGTLVVGMSNSTLGYVRSWNPIAGTWQPVGAGLNGNIQGLASDGVKLFAAGGFTASGVTTIFGAGQWDGNAWSSIGLPSAVTVTSVTVWNGKAVFPLPNAFGNGVGQMKVWDGLTLSTIPGDSLAYNRGYMTVSGRMLNQVGTWGTKLIVSGTLFRNGSTPVPGVAGYDGTQWSSIQEPWGPGMQGLVGYATDMRAWSGRLVVAGPFGLAGAGDRFEVTPGVAAWDGAKWTGFAEGLGGNDIFLGEYNGDVVAAGWRLYVRTDPTITAIARWDGTSWKRFGSNPPAIPTCVQQMHQDLYVGEDFGLHRWNGSTWSQVPGYVDAHALALSTTGDSLVVCGDGVATVGFWNGTSWLPAGAGVNARAYAATLWNGRIVIGGAFSASGATPLPGVAVWDGAAWQPLGGNAVAIWRLRVIDGELYGAGNFRLPNGSIVETVARYIEPDWQLLGSGSNNFVFEGYLGQLYQGGSGIVHGHVAHNLSRRPLPAPVLGAPPPQLSHVALTVGPNPVQTTAHFKFVLGSAGRARLTIIDLAGREVATVIDGPLGAGPHDLNWAARCAPGIYFARLQANGVNDVLRFARIKTE